jgi:hypothetical protein
MKEKVTPPKRSRQKDVFNKNNKIKYYESLRFQNIRSKTLKIFQTQKNIVMSH